MNIKSFPLVKPMPVHQAFAALYGQEKVNELESKAGDKLLALLEEVIDRDASKHVLYSFYFEGPITLLPELSEMGLTLTVDQNGFVVKGIMTGTRKQFEVIPDTPELKTLFSLTISSFQNRAIQKW